MPRKNTRKSALQNYRGCERTFVRWKRLVISSGLNLAQCSNGNCDAGASGSVRRRQHVAAAIKYPAGIDDQARGVNFPRNNTFGLNLHAALRKNHAVVAARDDHAISFDLTFDLGVFAQNQRLLGNDVSLYVAVNAKRSRNLQRAFHRDALIDKAGPLFAASIRCTARPFPRHKFLLPPNASPPSPEFVPALSL